MSNERETIPIISTVILTILVGMILERTYGRVQLIPVIPQNFNPNQLELLDLMFFMILKNRMNLICET
uniref:Uncharacterized protein n=1 Tax=Phlebotomus papatasi TaxID=29031 RepID=A0A1B0CZP6_PHLPP